MLIFRLRLPGGVAAAKGAEIPSAPEELKADTISATINIKESRTISDDRLIEVLICQVDREGSTSG